MRIFQVLADRATRGFPDGGIWLRNLYEPLLDMDLMLFYFQMRKVNGWF